MDKLVVDGVMIADQHPILAHVYNFLHLFSFLNLRLGLSLPFLSWSQWWRVSSEENEALMLPLFKEGIECDIKSTNANSASGPHGFSIPFFRKF